MKLRTTVQISSAIQKKPPLKREDSFLKRFSTRQIPETQVSYVSVSHWRLRVAVEWTVHVPERFILHNLHLQETVEDTGSESASGDVDKTVKRRRRYLQKRRSVVNPDENFYFYWLMMLTICVLYNLWTLIVRQSFPELQVSQSMLRDQAINVKPFVLVVLPSVFLMSLPLSLSAPPPLLPLHWGKRTPFVIMLQLL